jgi:hypothetical protein
MPERWIVEHTDDYGILHGFQYEHGHIAKDVADQTWQDYKHQPGHGVKISLQQNPDAPRSLVYAAGQR